MTLCVRSPFNLTVLVGHCMAKNELVAQSKTGCIMQKKHTFEHVLRGYDYMESLDEDARIYNAAISRTF